MKKVMFFLSTLMAVSIGVWSQNVGIGTPTPGAKLEVVGAGNNSTTSNLILKNSIGDTILRIRNDGRIGIGYNKTAYGRRINLAGNGINFFSDEETFSGSIFPIDSSLTIWSESGDNNYVNIQPLWGKVGIGTNTPQAKLDVAGTVILGANGTVINHVIKITVAKNLTTVPANDATIETFMVPGVNVGSAVVVSPQNPLADGLLISYARVSAVNTVEVKFMNVSAVAINPATMNFHIVVIE